MKKKSGDSTKKKGKKKKVVKKKETPVWGDPDCKSFAYHPVTGKPLNPFPNLREQESIIPFFSERVIQKRQELELKKKKEQEESQAGSLYRPINVSGFDGNKEGEEEAKPKPKRITDLHRFDWMNKESWIRCRLRQKNWSYNDMFLNVQCSWTLLRLKMEIKKHLFEGSLLPDNILIYKDDLSKINSEDNSDDEDNNNDNNYTQNSNANNTSNSNTHGNNTTNNGSKNSNINFSNNTTINNNTNNNTENVTSSNKNDSNRSKTSIETESNDDGNSIKDLMFFSKNQECSEPLYKLFPRIHKLKSIGNMIPFEEGYAKCEDNDYPILVVGQRPIHIYEPPPPPPTPVKKKVVKKKKKEGDTKKKSSTPKYGAKKKKVVKKKKKPEVELPPEEPVDPNAPHEPNDNELLELQDDDVEIYSEPVEILKNPDQYLYVYFDVNVPFVPS